MGKRVGLSFKGFSGNPTLNPDGFLVGFLYGFL